jgi:hypothetical protein
MKVLLKYFTLGFIIVNTILFPQTLRINEFMALNSSSIMDKDGEHSDWIEIYNSTTESIDLDGWSITNKKEIPRQWVFPKIIVRSNSYLIVYATGKDIAISGQQLHTNFKLSGEGEYLALIDPSGAIISEFDPYPQQQPDLSYAYFSGQYNSTATPTPGSENKILESQQLNPPQFSHKHGFYNSPFNATITSEHSNAKIYYTTNGNTPKVSTGTLYTTPVIISTTTVLRAIVVDENNNSSKVTTSTYLFFDSIKNQSNNPKGYPSMWGPYYEIEGQGIADYEMDPEIVRDPKYTGLIDEALLSLPTFSIVTDISNLFSHSTNPDSGGIYIYTGPADAGGPELGGDWERPVSIEYFNSSDSIDFQADCGLRIHGGHSRRVEKTPKHSFRIIFRSEYGSSKLDYPLFGKNASSSFNTLILRAGFGNMWTHHSSNERRIAQHIRDLWGKETQLDMMHPSGLGNYVHLYLNGIYWGIYNPTEQIDNDFAATYLGGNKEDYDILKDNGEVVDGNNNAWKSMMILVNQGLSDNTNYMRIQGKNPDGSDNPDYPPYLDIDNFIDYMLINFYGANWDWDHHNWVVVRNRINPAKGFRFFSWDAEHILEDVNSNILSENNANCPSRIFQQLRQNQIFCRKFADRVQLHFFNNGALTASSGIKRWMKFANQIDTAIIAESARWGDYRRDVHPWRPGGPFELYTKEHWLEQQSFMINTYFPSRSNTFIAQLKSAGLFPNLPAPQFYINGNPISNEPINSGDTLTMKAVSGTIYYTLDGTDPVLIEGNVAANAIKYTAPIILKQNVCINSRSIRSSDYSALSSANIELRYDYKKIKITEIHYHPLDEDSVDDKSFEFIELKNTDSTAVNIGGVRFIKGISYTFPADTKLNSEQFIVLASDSFYFNKRYGFGAFGTYNGSLDNSGELIVLADAFGDTIISVLYNDKEPWPYLADGTGNSLVPIDSNAFGDMNNPLNWRTSLEIHGSPGSNDIEKIINSVPENLHANEYSLIQNYPNPFNPLTVISYQLPVNCFIYLKVYDIMGQEIETLVKEEKKAGNYSVNFDAGRLSSGVYFYRIETNTGFTQTKKLLLLK